MSRSIAILLIVTVITLLGDLFIKRVASSVSGIGSLPMAIGALLYATSAVGWFYLMRIHSLTMIAVLFAASMVIGLTAMGVFLYDERFGLRDLAGILLAIIAVIIIHGR